MKKLIFAVLVAIFCLSHVACQQVEGDENYVYINNNDCGCDGDTTVVGPSGVNIFLQTSIAVGQWNNLNIDMVVDGVMYDVVDDYTVMDQAIYTYELNPADYHLEIWGFNYNASADFTVCEGQMTDVSVEMNEWPVPTFYLLRSPNSPSGLIVPGVHQKIYEIKIMHDWNQPLTPTHLGFYGNVAYNGSGTASIDNCELTILTLAGWNTIGGPVSGTPVYTGKIFEYTAPGSLDDTLPVYPGSVNTYALFCDVYGQSNDVISIGMYSFGAYSDVGYLIGNWPDISGLTF